jgi:hypothetical protein
VAAEGRVFLELHAAKFIGIVRTMSLAARLVIA